MNKPKVQKIGLFGGTFDPVHTGHLILAEFIREAAGLSKIYFIPTKIHPLKNNRHIQTAQHRLKMLEMATGDNPDFLISDFELQQPGTSYTIDTVKSFRQQYPPDNFELYFLVGADNLDQFHLWKQPDELVKLCQFILFGRPGYEISAGANSYASTFRFIEAPLLEISSTEIRKRVRQGLSIRYLVPPGVEDYIKKHTLYESDPEEE